MGWAFCYKLICRAWQIIIIVLVYPTGKKIAVHRLLKSRLYSVFDLIIIIILAWNSSFKKGLQQNWKLCYQSSPYLVSQQKHFVFDCLKCLCLEHMPKKFFS